MNVSRFCIPCMLTGASLLIWANVAAANPGGVVVSYEYVTKALLGILILVAGAYVKGIKDGMQKEISKNTSDIASLDELFNQLNLRILREYPSKVDLKDIIRSELSSVKQDIHAIKNNPQ